MGLTCYCDSGEYAYHYFPPDDFSTLDTRRGRRCISCKTWIRPGQECAKFERERPPNGDVEWRIHGDEVEMPPAYMCERCAGLYWALDELGYCIRLEDDMRELVKEYAKMRR